MPSVPILLIGAYTVVKVAATAVVWKRYRKRKRAKQEAAREKHQ